MKLRPTLEAVWPSSPLGRLGRIFGAISIFYLLQNTTQLGLSDSFRIIIEVYQNIIKVTIGLFDPLVEAVIDWIQPFIPFKIHYNTIWRHVFTVLMLLFVRDAGTAFDDGRRILGVVRLVVGLILSIMFSVLGFASPSSGYWMQSILLNGAIAVALLIYDIIMYWFSAFIFYNAIGAGENDRNASSKSFFLIGCGRSFQRFLIVLAASLIFLLLPPVRTWAPPTAAVSAALFGQIVNASYWIAGGLKYGLQQKALGIPVRVAFMESEAGRFGLAVTGVLFWSLMFCTLNAGARLLGL